jgi:hypothetical protein
MNACESENYLPISRSSKYYSVEIFWAEIYLCIFLTCLVYLFSFFVFINPEKLTVNRYNFSSKNATLYLDNNFSLAKLFTVQNI